ncbi:hypothetical protein [Pedobacter arcticus]|uniref:hypothetical protein n=1 Tax=Pedobacter arcticus TaxID=752140 RepID=UPI0002E1A783|nr:hypothetical protein [Pedobacter arcticus]
MKTFKDFNITVAHSAFTGDKIKISKILNREITVSDYKIDDSKFKGKCLCLQIELNGTAHVVFTSSIILMEAIKQVPKDGMPFKTTIIQENERYEFT